MILNVNNYENDDRAQLIKNHNKNGNLISKFNEKNIVLKNINLEIKPKEFFAIIGKVGSGMSIIFDF